MNNMAKSSVALSKAAFDKAAQISKRDADKPKPKVIKQKLPKVKDVELEYSKSKKVKTVKEPVLKNIDYSNDLEYVMESLSRVMQNGKLTNTERFTLDSYLSTIRGLQNTGNTKSAYMIAKNAMAFVSGASYPYEKYLSLQNSGVEVDISEKAKAFSPKFSDHIVLEENPSQKSEIGTLVNRMI